MAGPIDFFLNSSTDDAEVVEAPAFSLTKVMAVVAPVVTALSAVVTAALGDAEFSGGQVTTLIVALIAFLALTGSADVIARGIATAAEKRATAGLRMLSFVEPLAAKLSLPGKDEDVKVIAASDAIPPQYLCIREDKSFRWEAAGDISF